VRDPRRHLRYLRRKRDRRDRLKDLEPVRESPLALSLELEGESDRLLIAFGGMNQQIGIPPFEFFSLAGAIPVKRIFVRDLSQAWYHRGIPGAGEDLMSVAELLAGLIEGQGVRRLVAAGGSAGGYAALVFGSLLSADTVLSFSPQTILDMDELSRMGDHRWDDHLRPLVAREELDPRWIDLRQALPTARSGNTRYEVFVDESLGTDRRHVERLAGIEGMHIYRFGRGSHALVRDLRDSGALPKILRRALGAPEDGVGEHPARGQATGEQKSGPGGGRATGREAQAG
jgi:hypothetical protein